MDSMKNLTSKQQQLIKEIMQKEDRQRIVDKTVLITKLQMILDILQSANIDNTAQNQERIYKLKVNLEAIQNMTAW